MPLFARLLALLWLLASVCCAQHYPLDFLFPAAAPGELGSFTEDDDGFLIASHSGLFRYNGREVSSLGSKLGFTAEELVATRYAGALWVVSGSGLLRARDHQLQLLSPNPHESLTTVDRGLLFTWWKREDGPLHDQELEWVSRRQAESDAPRLELLPFQGHGTPDLDSQGTLWFPCGTEICKAKKARSSDLHRLNIEKISLAMGLPKDSWIRVLHDSAGRLWVRNRSRIFMAQSEGASFKEVEVAGVSAREGIVLMLDSDGAVWVSGERGLLQDQRGTRRLFPSRMFQGRPLTSFSALYRDRADNLWLGTQGGGAARWIGNGEITSWGPQDGLAKLATAILDDGCGQIYVRNHDQIFRLTKDEQHWEPYKRPDLGQSVSLFAGPPGKGAIAVSTKSADASHLRWNVYLGCSCGLRMFKKRLLTFPDDPVRIRGVKEDLFGNLWFATMNGLYGVSPSDRWRHFTARDGLLQTTLQCLGLTGDQSIWVGTDTPVGYSRLASLGPDLSGAPKWHHFMPSQTSYSTSTFFLGSDSRGNLWRGTGTGIQVSDSRHLEPSDSRLLNVHDGLSADDQMLDGFLAQADGTVWVANIGGITRFSPSFAPLRQRHVRASIVGQQWLSSDHRSIEFDLAITPPSLGYEAQLQYRVSSGAWKPADNMKIRLMDLPDGPHRLEVRTVPNRWLKNDRVAVAGFTIGSNSSYPGWKIAGLAAALFSGALLIWWRRRNAYWQLKALYAEVRPLGPEQRAARLARLSLPVRAKLSALLTHEAARDDIAGAKLADRFLLEHLVARGGFATVYFGRDLSAGNTPVAIKLVRERSSRAEWLQRKWESEQTLLARLDHPGIVRARFASVDEALGMYIVTDYVEGVTLRACLNQGAFSLQRLLHRAQEICSALEHAHAQGVIHCDLKPDNIMLRFPDQQQESAVLIDFGVAVLRTGAESITATAHVAGALDYIAPEQVGGTISSATDVYSLGAVVFEMLTGWRWREAESRRDTHSLLASLRFSTEATEQWVSLFSNALEFHREKRIQSAEDFYRRLDAVTTLSLRQNNP